MISIGKAWFLIAVALLILVVGCDENGDMGALEPLADEPMILESVLCLRIEDGRPAGITDSFLESDDKVYIWMYWTGIETVSTIEVLWFEPGEDTAALVVESQEVSSSSGFVITWFSINKPDGGFAEGDWSVDVYIDDMFERSYVFTIED